MIKAMKMHDKDDVATCLEYVIAQEKVAIFEGAQQIQVIEALQPIAIYHKIALHAIAKNEFVYKYGEVIGKATQDIKLGEHIHISNVESVMTK